MARGADDVFGFHIVFGIIVVKNDNDARVFSATSLYQIVKIREIFNILSQQNELLSNGLFQMLRVGSSCGSNILRTNHGMAGLLQKAGQGRVVEVIVQIQIHSSP